MIYLDSPLEHNVGGPLTFLRNLHTYLNKKNYPVASSIYQSRSIFFPISYDKKILDFYTGCGFSIIQRLDGIYYPSQHGNIYKIRNKLIESIYRNIATHVVFQSEYSKKQCFAMLGKKQESSYSIITNGADKSIFFPLERQCVLDRSRTIRFIVTGNFRKKGMLEFPIKALISLVHEYSVELHVVGPVSDKLKHMIDKPFIIEYGSLSIGRVAELLRSCDIFLHSQLNDNCPNAVIEAISCGLPVVGFNSGAMSELCFFNDDLLTYVSDDIFQTYDQFDVNKFVEKIKLCVDNFEIYKKKALVHAHLYDFKECGTKYVEVFERELKKNPNVSKKRRFLEYKKLQLRIFFSRIVNILHIVRASYQQITQIIRVKKFR